MPGVPYKASRAILCILLINARAIVINCVSTSECNEEVAKERKDETSQATTEQLEDEQIYNLFLSSSIIYEINGSLFLRAIYVLRHDII